jgi:phosphoglycerate kinase
VRVDYNVVKNGKIKRDKRIRATIPTIKYLLSQGASVVLMSHNERPKGKVDPLLSLEPAAASLQKLLEEDENIKAGKIAFGGVQFVHDCVGQEVQSAAQALKPGQVLLLENTRFHKEEEQYEKYAKGELSEEDAAKVVTFAQELASLGDVVVQDAFGAVHRAHGSTAGMFEEAKKEGKEIACGLLVEKELNYLGNVMENPEQPFAAILGGAKVSDKIKVIENLLEKVNVLVIGGAMAYTFLAAQGIPTGDSRIEADQIEFAKAMIAKAKEKGVQLILPVDHVVVKKGSIDFDTMKLLEGNDLQITEGADIADGYMAVDIGPKTIALIQAVLSGSKTIMWNGPAGVFEIDELSVGTIAEAEAMAAATEKGAITIVGGGDSVTAAEKAQKSAAKENRELKFSHLSTGGGASLEFLEGKKLPGVEVL